MNAKQPISDVTDDQYVRQLITALRENAARDMGVQLDADGCKVLIAYIERLAPPSNVAILVKKD